MIIFSMDVWRGPCTKLTWGLQGESPNLVMPAQAGIQVVTQSEGSQIRCFAWLNELGSSLRWNDGLVAAQC
jgi:hypothetical protein